MNKSIAVALLVLLNILAGSAVAVSVPVIAGGRASSPLFTAPNSTPTVQCTGTALGDDAWSFNTIVDRNLAVANLWTYDNDGHEVYGADAGCNDAKGGGLPDCPDVVADGPGGTNALHFFGDHDDDIGSPATSSFERGLWINDKSWNNYTSSDKFTVTAHLRNTSGATAWFFDQYANILTKASEYRIGGGLNYTEGTICMDVDGLTDGGLCGDHNGEALLPNDAAWHHFAFVYDGPSGTYTVYMDGSQISQQTGITGGPISNQTSITQIGDTNGNVFELMYVDIDNLQIFHDVALSEVQVEAANCEVGGVPSGGESAPVASFTAHRTTGVAPLYVHFDALATTDADNDIPSIQLNYEWNFGDPGAGNWAYGAIADDGTGAAGVGPDKNVDYGMVAGHVFEEPGVYTVTLFVRDAIGGVASEDTATITVSDTTGYTTHCFSNDTDQTGCTGTPHNSISDLDVALNTTCNADSGTLVICSFQRGDTFNGDISSQMLLSGSNVIIKAHDGAGAKPILNMNFDTGVNQNNAFFHVVSPISDYKFIDLDIRGTDAEFQAAFDLAESGGSPDTIDDTLWLRVDFSDFDGAFEIEGNPGEYGPDGDATIQAMHHNWAFVDSTILDANGCHENDFFAMGHGFSFMGSKVGDKEDPHPVDGINNTSTSETWLTCTGGSTAGATCTRATSTAPDTCVANNGVCEAKWEQDGACQPGGSEHNVRFKFTDRGVIKHNAFGLFTDDVNHDGCGTRDSSHQKTNSHSLKQIAGFSSQHPPDPDGDGPLQSGGDTAGYSRHFVIGDNAFHICSESATAVDIDATDGGQLPEHIFEYDFSGNICYGSGVETRTNPICFDLGGADFKVTNNVCEFNGGILTGGTCIRIEDRRDILLQAVPSPVGALVYNNTCHHGDDGPTMSSGRCVDIVDGTGTDISNNLEYGEDVSPDVIFIGTAATGTTYCNGGAETDCNQDCTSVEPSAGDCDTNNSDTNPFTGTLVAPIPLSEFSIDITNAHIVDEGVDLGVLGAIDALNACRTAAMDIGAIERGAAVCPSTP